MTHNNVTSIATVQDKQQQAEKEFNERRKRLLLEYLDQVRQEVENDEIANMAMIIVDDEGDSTVSVATGDSLPAINIGLDQLKMLIMEMYFDYE